MVDQSSETVAAMEAAREKLREKFQTNGTRLGGKGSVRRKKRVPHKTSNTADDRKLQVVLKRLGLATIPGIEEVNLLCNDGTILHFVNPKVQASPAANTYVITGHAASKKRESLFSDVLDNTDELMQSLKAADGTGDVTRHMAKLLQDVQKASVVNCDKKNDDDDVPDLQFNFDDTID